MIVVLGRPAIVPTGEGDASEPGGLAVGVATAIAAAGESVELVGSIGEDADGDLVAVTLGRAGVGHAALLRDPAGRTPRRPAGGVGPGPSAADARLPRLDADDVSLGLRYLPSCRVLVIADALDPRARAAAIDGAAYHGASVIAVVGSAAEVNDGFAGAIVLLAPEPGEVGTGDSGEEASRSAFEAFVAECAVRIARGSSPEAALAEAVTAGAWEPSDG